MMTKKILEMRNITKYIFDEYGKAIRNTTVKILEDVFFDLEPGEVHVLVGENGAGKSTLMNILGGVIMPDSGTVLLDGKNVKFAGTLDARNHGIAFIHQELNTCVNLDIAHNIFLGREPLKNGFVDAKSMYLESERLLENFGYADINPHTVVRDLSTAKQQVVEIVKAMSYQSRIIIMDEPTSSLSRQEIEHLFALIKRLRSQGVSIIYISHRFDELLEIGDRLTVLRDGKSIATISMAEFDYERVVSLMVGREVGTEIKRAHVPTKQAALAAQGVKISKRTPPISITVNKGEVVGLGGLVGAGRTELAKSIFGARKIFAGRVMVGGESYDRTTPGQSVKRGVCYLSEDRKLEGLITRMSIIQNITMASLERIFPKHIIKRKKERAVAQLGIRELNVVCINENQRVNALSGGNQQKVLFSKWLSCKPEILILDEPTRGIDVNAKNEIYGIIDRIAQNGVAILLISSELPELIGLSDRIYVMCHGAVTAELTQPCEMTQENILRCAMPSAGVIDG